MSQKNKLAHPLFLLAVLVLIVNDWILKASFQNVITGKLSDFAGLFGFAFFLSIIFPKQAKSVHVLTGLIFIFWKSELAQPFIDSINNIGIPVRRTVDWSDAIALISIPFSYFIFLKEPKIIFRPIIKNAVIAISCLAFMATSLPPGERRKFVDVDKVYEFKFSKRELVSRLNTVQLKAIREMGKDGVPVDFNSKTNTFHLHGQNDTLAVMLDYETIRDLDTIQIHSSYAEMQLVGDSIHSELKLLSVYKYVPSARKKDFRERAIKDFEQIIIKKIRKYQSQDKNW